MICGHWDYFSLVKFYNFQDGQILNCRFKRGDSGANSTNSPNRWLCSPVVSAVSNSTINRSEIHIKEQFVHLISFWRIQMEKNKWLKKWTENLLAYVEHRQRGLTTFNGIGRHVRFKVEFVWISMILTIETMPRKKTYAQILTVDVFYGLTVCKACNIGLPFEWAKSHCVKHRVTVALSLNVIDLGKRCGVLELVEWKTRKNIRGMSGLDGVG